MEIYCFLKSGRVRAGVKVSIIIKQEWKVWLPFSVLMFLLGNLVLSGFTFGGIPNFAYPLIYNGDGLLVLSNIQRIMEGSLYENFRLGAPLGSITYDYTLTDYGQFFIFKFLSIFTSSAFVVVNIYILLSFTLVFIVTYFILRLLNLPIIFAVLGAFIYDFIPFHWRRLEHTYYLMYFVAPIFFYYGYKIFIGIDKITKKDILLNLPVVIIISLFGVYYTAFGMLVIFISTVAGALKKNTKSLAVGIAICVIAGSIVFMQIVPTMVYKAQNGTNQTFGVRPNSETEMHSLKLAQLLLPTEFHRLAIFRVITMKYNRTFPLVYENSTATLGIVGVVGFFVLLFAIVFAFLKKNIDERIGYFSIVTLFLFLFTTVGGFSSLFTLLISPMLRGWNRASIFIAFACVAAFVIMLQYLLYKINIKKVYKIALVAAIGVLAFLDQTPYFAYANMKAIIGPYDINSRFIQDVERSLPKGASIFQLPYVSYPENPPIFNQKDYEHFYGFLHSKDLKWSYGGMKGRDADRLYRTLSYLATNELIAELKRYGFAGIYINRVGYSDGAEDLLNELSGQLGQNFIASSDGKLIFFPIN